MRVVGRRGSERQAEWESCKMLFFVNRWKTKGLNEKGADAQNTANCRPLAMRSGWRMRRKVWDGHVQGNQVKHGDGGSRKRDKGEKGVG